MIQPKLTPYWLAAVLLPDIGPRSILHWLESFSSIEALFTAAEDEWRASGIPEKHFSALRLSNWKGVESELAWANGMDQHIITLSDPDYPILLKEITDPPLVLYVRGERSALQQQQMAMVGARNATPIGLENAAHFACQLAEAGLTITSGLALGVDGASHRGALAGKGKTIAVMGTGQSHLYPSAHKTLAKDIVTQGGAIVTEFPLNVMPQAQNFPRRNRIISGMSVGVLLVEAAIKSGSLITARHAMEQNRDVFAIPGSIHNPLSRGCHHLIRQGAKLVETAQDVLEELQLAFGKVVSTGVETAAKDCSVFQDRLVSLSRHALGRDTSRSQEQFRLERQNGPSQLSTLRPHDPLLKQNRALLELVDYAITPFDVIVLRSGLTIGEVSSMLLTLTLDGYVQTVAGGYMRIASVN